jgi:hypothetical protein
MKRGSTLALVLLAVLLLRRAAVSTPAGLLVVTRIGTGGADWLAKRLAALAAHGISDEVARAIVAQWSLETDTGKAEWNFNVGNRIANPGDLAYELDVSGEGKVFFKAYTSLDSAVVEYLALLQGGHYAACWTMLEASPTSDAWVRCLGLKGYYTANVDRYAAGYLARYKQLFPVG